MFVFAERIGSIRSTEADMRSLLREIWFRPYARSPKRNVTDSSGFEYVFVGEKKTTKVNGFHNWIQFYLLEKSGAIDYQGYNFKEEVRKILKTRRVGNQIGYSNRVY